MNWVIVNGRPQLTAGGGSQNVRLGGSLFTTSATAATGANTDLTTFATYTLPGGTMANDGDILRVTMWGDLGATGNTKNMFLVVGNDGILSRASAGNDVGFWLQGITIRINATQHDFMGVSMVNGETTFTSKTTQAANETWAVSRTVTFKGQNGSAAANDIVFHGGLVEYIPAAA